MTRFTQEAIARIQAKCAESGAIFKPEDYVNANTPFPFVCACGQPHQLKWITVQAPRCTIRCRACSNAAKSAGKRLKAETDGVVLALKAKCAEFGATYVEGSYLTAQIPFKFLCVCGASASMRWVNAIRPNRGIYCWPCAITHKKRGPEHYNWNPDLTQEEREGNYPVEVQNWGNRLMQKAKFTCAISGQKGKVAAHHMWSRKSYPKFATVPENGIVISRELHLEFHQTYGFGDNTPHQFAEFYRAKTGEEFYIPTILLPQDSL